MFTRQNLRWLRQNEALLAELAQEDLTPRNTLLLLTRLRKTLSAEQAAVALETATLRQKAAQKFQQAAQMFFTAEALQQATTARVAQFHAECLRGHDVVLDMGCSIGGDSIAFGQHSTVIGFDQDPIRLMMAQHNTQIYDAMAHFIQADIQHKLPLSDSKSVAAFFDPARRDDGKRKLSVHDYLPPLDSILAKNFGALLIKISPGVDLDELAPYDVGITFVSENGDLKEALLHGGMLASAGTRAVRLPENLSLTSQNLPPPPITDRPLRYLYEPDPAIIRSGLFGELLAALNLEAYRFDEDIAYLTGDEAVESPWLRSWRIDDWLPFNLKRLRSTLQAKNIGKVTVKKRGSPILPEELQRLLKLKKGAAEAVVILTQLKGQHIAIIADTNP